MDIIFHCNIPISFLSHIFLIYTHLYRYFNEILIKKITSLTRCSIFHPILHCNIHWKKKLVHMPISCRATMHTQKYHGRDYKSTGVWGGGYLFWTPRCKVSKIYLMMFMSGDLCGLCKCLYSERNLEPLDSNSWQVYH